MGKCAGGGANLILNLLFFKDLLLRSEVRAGLRTLTCRRTDVEI